MLEKVSRMTQSVIFTALVLAVHVEVFNDDIEYNQSDGMCFPESKMENGTRKSDKICHVKMDELSRQYLNDFVVHFERKMHKNVKTSRQHLKEELTHIESKLKIYIDQTKNESLKQSETVRKNIDELQEIFTKEIEKVQNDLINYNNRSKHQYSRLVHQLQSQMRQEIKTSKRSLSKEMINAQNKLISFIESKLNKYVDQTKNESIKQCETVRKNIDELQEIFTKEIEKVKNDLINYNNRSKHEYSRLVHQLQSQMRQEIKTSQNSLSKEMIDARNKLISFMNQSKIESNGLIKETKTDIREDIAKMTEIMDNVRDLSGQSRNEFNGLTQLLKREIQENITTLQKYIANEVRNSRSNINYEIKNHISEYGSTIWTVCAIQVIIIFFCCWKRSSKSTSQQQKLESETPELNMENSVAVVSFTEENRDLHLNIARTVTSAYRIHSTYVGGLNKISSIELNSKVCLVFVDKNERNIILETDVDISTTRSNFVEGQVKRGSTHVVVVYCQHEGSQNLTTLYNRNLGNIKQHATLRQLQRQNRVLTIDKEFSPYQTDYLRMFLNEMFME